MAAEPCRAVAAECGRAMSGSGGQTRPRHVGRWRPRVAAPCRVALMGHGPQYISARNEILLRNHKSPNLNSANIILISAVGGQNAKYNSRQIFWLYGIYRIAGIFRGGKFSRKPLQLYYSNYSRAEFSRNAPSSAKNYPFCTELTVRAALCNHTLARHLFAG